MMQNKRILIVDDHQAILEITREALLYERYEVQVISEGWGFFEAVKNFKPDLILLDYKLSDANGGDLCAGLKAMPEFSHIPVVISSAYFNKGSAANPGGCDGILYKPFNLDELLATVKEFTGKSLIYEG
jgi:CheY-like chemotaxis protein